jgi:hypothetical protein
MLLDRLSRQRFASMSTELREEILQFYNNPAAPYATRKDRKAWAKVQAELQQLRMAQPASNVAAVP